MARLNAAGSRPEISVRPPASAVRPGLTAALRRIRSSRAEPTSPDQNLPTAMHASLVHVPSPPSTEIRSTAAGGLRTMGPRRAEVVPVDAYSSYIKRLSDARLGELRREAADYKLSTTARIERRARWAAALRRLLKRRPTLPQPMPVPPQAWASNSKPSSR